MISIIISNVNVDPDNFNLKLKIALNLIDFFLIQVPEIFEESMLQVTNLNSIHEHDKIRIHDL